MGPNVLALAPRVALALEGNDETRRRMERAGVDVRVYRGDEISRKGDGGPTCLTRPLRAILSATSTRDRPSGGIPGDSPAAPDGSRRRST